MNQHNLLTKLENTTQQSIHALNQRYSILKDQRGFRNQVKIM